jgi:hypothetical protein
MAMISELISPLVYQPLVDTLVYRTGIPGGGEKFENPTSPFQI